MCLRWQAEGRVAGSFERRHWKLCLLTTTVEPITVTVRASRLTEERQRLWGGGGRKLHEGQMHGASQGWLAYRVIGLGKRAPSAGHGLCRIIQRRLQSASEARVLIAGCYLLALQQLGKRTPFRGGADDDAETTVIITQRTGITSGKWPAAALPCAVLNCCAVL